MNSLNSRVLVECYLIPNSNNRGQTTINLYYGGNIKHYFLFITFILLSGCINVRMANIQPKLGSVLEFNGILDIPKETTNYLYTFQMGTGRISIYLGESFSNYIPYYINTEENKSENKLQILINNFSMEGNSFKRAANLETRFIITQYEDIIFDEVYITSGKAYPQKIGINPVLRKTTDDAVSEAFEQFSQDVSEMTDLRLTKIIYIEPEF